MSIFRALPHHHILSIMPTYQCTAECMHCGTLSSPREKTWLPVEDMLSAIDQAADNGYVLVVFTGGEPTLAGKNLLLGIKRAASRGMIVRIVTNACWAASDKAADRHIADFIRAGLREINFSTGDQHARFVPIEKVIRATRAAVKANLPTVCIMIETLKERKITKEVIENHPDFKQILQDFPGAKIRLLESPWMPLSPSKVDKYPKGMAVNRSNLAMHTGCNSILSTTTIQADGRIGACCGLGMRTIPELQLGNIRDTKLAEADKKAADDFLKRWIRMEGPEQILAWAAGYDAEIEWEEMYAHRCQACLRLYKDPKVRNVISQHYEEKIPDVLFGEWLLYHYNAEISSKIADFDTSQTGEGLPLSLSSTDPRM